MFGFFSSWREDTYHRLMAIQWGKSMVYLKAIMVMCPGASPQRIFPSIRSVPQRGTSKDSRPPLTPVKPIHRVTLYHLIHSRHHLTMGFWGREKLIPGSWQQSNPWAGRPNPTESHPSLPLFRACRGCNGAPPPSHGRSLPQRLVGALLFFESSSEIYFLWVSRVILRSGWTSWWLFLIHWAWGLPCGRATMPRDGGPGLQWNRVVLSELPPG